LRLIAGFVLELFCLDSSFFIMVFLGTQVCCIRICRGLSVDDQEEQADPGVLVLSKLQYLRVFTISQSPICEIIRGVLAFVYPRFLLFG
jgi:hypothetical protein